MTYNSSREYFLFIPNLHSFECQELEKLMAVVNNLTGSTLQNDHVPTGLPFPAGC